MANQKKNYADKFSESQLLSLETKLSRLYREAYKDAKADAEKYWKGWNEVVNGKVIRHEGFLERYNHELQAKDDGAYTDDQWKAWINSQMGRGTRLDGVADDIADRMSKTNEIAAEYINGTTPKIYAETANFEAFLIEKEHRGAVSFRIVQESSQKLLSLGENHTEFRTVRTNPQRDYNWNFDRIQTALQIGLVKGEGMDKIAARFLQTMGSNQAAAVRNARTAVTSARSAGRMDTFEQADEMGIEVEKEWKATFDDKTRDSHAELDGERVPYDEPFSNGLMYPGDPDGEPSEVYNCRCAMGRVTSHTEDRYTVQEYREWLEGKEHDKSLYREWRESL